MKVKLKYFKYVLIYCAILTFLACNKNDDPITSKREITKEGEEFENVRAFLAKAVSFPLDSVRFDSATNTFYINNTQIRENYDRVKTIYDRIAFSENK